MWSIFKSRTAWADHITCGTSIYIMYRVVEKVEVRVTVSVTVCVVKLVRELLQTVKLINIYEINVYDIFSFTSTYI